MSFCEEMKYVVFGRRGIQNMTAKELYNRVMEDSKSNYNWIASATDLINVCNKKNFPEEKANMAKC